MGGVGVVVGTGIVVVSADFTACVLAELQPVSRDPASNSDTIARMSVLNVRLDIKHSPFS